MKLRELIGESLGDDFKSFLKDKGIKHRVRGTPDEERQRTQDMIAQRANAPAHVSQELSSEERFHLEQELGHLEAQFDPNYQYSDDHSVYTKHHSLAQRINSIKHRLKQGVAEGSTMSWIVYRQDTTLYPNGERDHETEVVKTFNNDQEAEDYANKLNAANRDVDVYYFVRGKQQGVAEAANAAQQAAIAIAKKKKKNIKETATAGATSAANIGTVDAPQLSPGKARGKRSYTGSPGTGSGTKAPPQPKVVQPKNSDGTAKNGLDIKGTSLFGSPKNEAQVIKRR